MDSICALALVFAVKMDSTDSTVGAPFHSAHLFASRIRICTAVVDVGLEYAMDYCTIDYPPPFHAIDFVDDRIVGALLSQMR